ncbi:MAG: glycosyltransferase [Promethearchaeota archaeon]
MENKDKIWIFTFEYKEIAKVGGLGEVSSNHAKNLAEKYEITVFIPSHGQLNRLYKTSSIKKLPFNCVGQLDPTIFGINRHESSYSIGFYKFKKDNVNIILLSGENNFTSSFLDDEIVYNPDTFSIKMCLYSIGIRSIIDFFIKECRQELPEIVHLHDYHVVIPFIGMKQVLKKYGLDLGSIITIHLLTWPRFDLNFYRACGIDDTPIKVFTKDGYKEMNIKEIFIACEKKEFYHDNYEPPTVEKVGAYISDMVTTVSKSYLDENIIPVLGFDLIGFKTDFIWNGCDWNYDLIINEVFNAFGDEMHKVLQLPKGSEITREDMKKYLLTYKIGNLSESPLINSKKILEKIKQISTNNPYIKNGSIAPFDESGPLMITTGRISPQKGFETIFESIPQIIKHIPDAKLLFLLFPTDYSLKEMEDFSEYIKQYPKNLRIIFGVTTEIYKFAHIVSDVYAALSRWEPFGITALEAMASKLPVIATRVGGLQESVIDIKNDPINGTGILIDKDDPYEFAKSLISLFTLSRISNNPIEKKIETEQEINSISDEVIKFIAINDNEYYNKMKENCIKRVNKYFRWNIVTAKLAILYDKIKK